MSENELPALQAIAQAVAAMEPHENIEQNNTFQCVFCGYMYAEKGNGYLCVAGTERQCDRFHAPDCIYLKAKALVATTHITQSIPVKDIVFEYRRLAFLIYGHGPLAWFGDVVRTEIKDGTYDPKASLMAMERICEEAVAQFGLDYFKRYGVIVRGPTEQSLE